MNLLEKLKDKFSTSKHYYPKIQKGLEPPHRPGVYRLNGLGDFQLEADSLKDRMEREVKLGHLKAKDDFFDYVENDQD